MPELSVIIPFVNEYPQAIFTIRNIAEELRDRVDFEIIAVDNYCEEVKQQGRDYDTSGPAIKAAAGNIGKDGNPCTPGRGPGHKWLSYIKYDKKLSHWQAKNEAIKYSSGKFLWFCDAHCIVSRDALYNMFQYYKQYHGSLNGTMHLPLTYKIMEWGSLIYKMVWNVEGAELHYSFTRYRPAEAPYQVPCMSTCGMMMSRSIYDELGGWPKELGIYGGGENFVNYCLSILGKSKWIFPGPPLCHHGEKRGYSYNYDDYTRNRTIATYMFGGKDLARKFILARKGKENVLKNILEGVFQSCLRHREHIKSHQRMDLYEWIQKWS